MMSSCKPPRASPGVMTAFFLPANSIDSLLPTIGIQISGPGAGDDLIGFLVARAGILERDIVNLIFARNAARKTRDQPAVRQAIQHREFFGQPKWFVRRQQGTGN